MDHLPDKVEDIHHPYDTSSVWKEASVSKEWITQISSQTTHTHMETYPQSKAPCASPHNKPHPPPYSNLLISHNTFGSTDLPIYCAIAWDVCGRCHRDNVGGWRRGGDCSTDPLRWRMRIFERHGVHALWDCLLDARGHCATWWIWYYRGGGERVGTKGNININSNR